MQIDPCGSVSLFGHTRSGKTVAARHLLWLAALRAEERKDPYYQVFILWTKPEAKPIFTPRHFPGCSVAVVRSVMRVTSTRARVVICTPPYSEKNHDGYEYFFRQIWHRQQGSRGWPATVYVDEANHVTEFKANGGPPSFRRCYTEGHGLNLGVWAGCQDPVFLQREMLSQLDTLLVFHIQRPKDRKLLSEEIGLPLPARYPDRYGFYARTVGEEVLYYPNIQTATGIEVIL